MTRRGPEGPLTRAVAGAAAGAAWLALASLPEILRPAVPLTEPWRDLARVALGGAAAGFVLGALSARLRFLAPGLVVLGAGLAAPTALERLAAAGDDPAGGALRAAGILLAGAVAGQAAGLLLRRLRPIRRPGPALSLAVLALLALPFLVPRAEPRRAFPRPNVLLLTIDTLRADRLGFAGHPTPTSPHLDRLARRGITRDGVVTPLPRTLPAVCSLLTGREPHSHGVRDNFHYALGPAAFTLAEAFAVAGWSTGAVNSNPVLSHESGVYQGFASASDRGDDRSRLRLVRGVERVATLVAMRRGDRADVITGLALRWLRTRPADRPFFLWVHWLSPHMPYEPEPPFDTRFDPGYEGAYARRIDYGEVSKGDMTYRNPLSPAEIAHVKTLYDGEVATADRALGRLLREMELSGDLENTVIVATADHGESLDEHGYFLNHGDFVYGPAANIPMIVVPADGDPAGVGAPEGGAGVDRTPMSLVDVAPLLLHAADVDAPDGMDGRVPAADRRPVFGESGFCRFPQLNDRLGYLLPPEIAQSPDAVPDWEGKWQEQANRAKQRFLQTERSKLVLSPRPDGDRWEWFDRRADPGEQRAREASGAEADSLKAALLAWIELGKLSAGTAQARSLSEEDRERLKALGYLGN